MEAKSLKWTSKYTFKLQKLLSFVPSCLKPVKYYQKFYRAICISKMYLAWKGKWEIRQYDTRKAIVHSNLANKRSLWFIIAFISSPDLIRSPPQPPLLILEVYIEILKKQNNTAFTEEQMNWLYP